MIGVVLIRDIDPFIQCAEIGYFIDQKFEGKGIVTLLCKKMLAYIFDDLHLNKTLICCETTNERSKAIPVKLGFKQEGVLRDGIKVGERYGDLVMYGLLKKEYSAKKL